MLGIGIVLSIFGLGFFCWLLFALAIHAVPFLAGLTAGLAALGQMVFATARKPLIRIIIGLLYAVPATVVGYQVSFALAGIGMSSSGWRTAFAVIGAVLSACTAFSRLALFVTPPDGQGTRSAYSPADGRLHDQGR